MFAVLAAAVYGYFEKRIKNKALATLCYFLAIGLIWAVVTFCIGYMISARDIALGRGNPAFLRITPLIGFALGEIYAFFSWILGLRNSGDDTKKKD